MQVHMIKSNSHNHEKVIQKALHDLFTDEYSTIAVTACIYVLFTFILEHHFHRCQNQVLKHAAYQLLISNEKEILER